MPSDRREAAILTCPDTGAALTRCIRPFAVSYQGATEIVDLPGYYPKGSGDGVHVGDDMSMVDAALARLKRF